MKIINFLILIPCRKGSQGVRNKNFLKVKNNPIYWYSVKHAKIIKNKYKSSFIGITTDNNKILKKKIKDVFLINRPSAISKNNSKSSETLMDKRRFTKTVKINYAQYS